MIATCPTDSELTSLLNGEWSVGSIDALENHLAICTSCRDRLETLSNSSRLNDWLSGLDVNHSQYPYLTPSDQPGDLGRIGRYSVESEIGRGGMGLVFKAWDTELQRKVALKVLRIGKDDQSAATRFAREARTAGKIRHDHLVPVLDVTETDDGRPVIVMPWIEGFTLQETLRHQTTFTPQRAAVIIRQIADALHAIHCAGLIHRDVKPSNILIDKTDGRAKVTDFGLSRMISEGETLTQDGSIVGTPEYLSPEQSYNAARVDIRSDLYSLGVVLYECLAGFPPFRGSSFDVITKHRQDEPVLLRTLNSSIPVDLETIAIKLLAKRPEQRYTSAEDLRNDIDHWLNNRPIVARRAGPSERVAKWCRRNPWPVVVTIVAVVGLLVSTIGWWRAIVATRVATQREADAKISESLANDSRKLADDRSLLALNAINTLITKSQNLIGDTPGTLSLKKQLNEAALADLRTLSQAVSSVPGTNRSTALAHLKLGDTYNLLGRSDDAVAQWQSAIQETERILTTNTNDFQARLDKARAHYAIGFSENRLSRTGPAAEQMDASIHELEVARTIDSQNRKVRENLAVAYTGRGDVYWTTQSAKNALASYTAAIEIDRQLTVEFPDDSELKSKLLYVLGRKCYIQLEFLHDYQSAEMSFREQYAIAKIFHDVKPNDPKWRRNYYITGLDLSAALQRQGQFSEAESLALSSLKPLADIAKADPENGLAQRDHAYAWNHLGLVQIASGRFAEAEASFNHFREILESVASRASRVDLVSSDLPSAYGNLAHVCERQGKFKESVSWLSKMLSATETHLAGNLQLIQASRKQVKEFQDAVSLTPEYLRNHILPKDLSPQTYTLATYYGTTHLARSGHLEEARSEIELAIRSHPNEWSLLSAKAVIEGIAEKRATSDSERSACLNAGRIALLAAIRANRNILKNIHTIPEYVVIRKQPEFQAELAIILNSK